MTMVQERLGLPEILSRLSWGESVDTEFKSVRGGLPKSLWETYSGMANTCGGVILLGIENDGKVIGVTDVERIAKNFWDTVNNRTKVSINLLDNEDVQVIPVLEGDVIAIRVPKTMRNQRPVYIGQNPIEGTYKRNSEGDYRCTEAEVLRMLADRSDLSADGRVLEHFKMDELDLQSLKQYRQRFASHRPMHPWLDEDDKGLLTKLGGWRLDRGNEKGGLTLAGLLMFGREETLREALPNYQLDFREYLLSGAEARWTDRFTLDGTWPGNLYQFYVRVIQKLNVDLKLPFQLDKDLFRKGETVVHIAIREALVNALIHADYQGIGGVVIAKYPDRFEFSNPGSLLISMEQLLFGNVSECRNKFLQTMFTMIGAAEKAGSGVDKIRVGWQSQHWRSPAVREQVQPDRVSWVLPMMSLIPSESLDRLKNIFGTKFATFSPLEIQALVTADIEGVVDNMRMRQITEKHAADITKVFKDLVSKEALIQDGQGRWSRYLLPELHDSVHIDNHSAHNDGGSVHKMANHSVHIGQLSSNQLDMLIEIARPAKENTRVSPKKMEQIILKLCNGRWLTRRQLSDLLGRNSDGLRSRFLTQMVSHNLLRLRYPDKPNRVDQAYTTADLKDFVETQ